MKLKQLFKDPQVLWSSSCSNSTPPPPSADQYPFNLAYQAETCHSLRVLERKQAPVSWSPICAVILHSWASGERPIIHVDLQYHLSGSRERNWQCFFFTAFFTLLSYRYVLSSDICCFDPVIHGFQILLLSVIITSKVRIGVHMIIFVQGLAHSYAFLEDVFC